MKISKTYSIPLLILTLFIQGTPKFMSLVCDLDPKFFYALLNGSTQRIFYEKISFSEAYLQEQLFASSVLSQEEQLSVIEEVSRLLLMLASTNASSERVADVLRETNMSEDHQNVFLAFWKAEGGKVRNKIVFSFFLSIFLFNC